MALDFPNVPTPGQQYPVTPIAGQPTYIWDGVKWVSSSAVIAGVDTSFRNYLTGLSLAYVGLNQFWVTAGGAAADDNSQVMTLPGTLTKNLNAPWSVGAGGALDTGAQTQNVWYHVFLIKRVDTGVVDILASLSPTAPTMPANYTKKRRIGGLRVDGGGSIYPFTQNGDEFVWWTPATDYSTALVTTAVMVALGGCPPGVKTLVKMRVSLTTTSSGAGGCLISGPDENDNALNTPPGNYSMWTYAATTFNAALVEAWTNTAQQVRVRGSQTTMPFNIATRGYVDMRGKFA